MFSKKKWQALAIINDLQLHVWIMDLSQNVIGLITPLGLPKAMTSLGELKDN